MNKRPIAVTGVSLLMMAAGVFGLARGFAGTKTLWPFPTDLIWIVILDLTGIACGVFMLRGRNWARWLTLAWIAGHVVIASFFMRQAILVHAVIFVLIAYLLIFRSDVQGYFRGAETRDGVG